MEIPKQKAKVGNKREKARKRRRNLHDVEFYNLYSRPKIVSVIKSWGILWAKHVGLMEVMRNVYKICQKTYDHLGYVIHWITELGMSSVPGRLKTW
jgi:hypothetical protein